LKEIENTPEASQAHISAQWHHANNYIINIELIVIRHRAPLPKYEESETKREGEGKQATKDETQVERKVGNVN